MASPKTVLITGTSSGIGKSLAKLLNDKGFKVFATARKTESISDLTALGITAFALDVDSPESITKLKADIAAITGGKLDMLINNAGKNLTVPAVDLDMDEVEGCFRTNLFGTFTPLLIEAKGTIVQIGSVAGIMPYVFGSAYNASKAALHAYSNTLRVELAPFDVKVITIVTGGVVSNIARTERVLGESSIYQPITKEYARRTKHSQEVGMDTEKYAQSVLKQLLVRSPPRYIWEGFGSYLVWFVSTFMPKWMMDWYFTREFNLNKLRQTKKNV
ncbi:NAD(P)-binding protein [Microthyrium microscopicum]|uniref:NAD(P)-binding protein n=1 Tax=Microthyrium microscopicum TaxID=703497 RepID=A0A6A6U9X4_9PEZI|nr:NAD(P)-binding protein [Microthyrium microscopicum]